MPIIKELTTEDLLYNARENNKKLKQKIDKYKQTLEEIRTIEITAYHSSNLEPLSQMQLMENIIDGYEQRRIRILEKIKEVLNDRD